LAISSITLHDTLALISGIGAFSIILAIIFVS
jgi:hypothetical protein